MKGEENHFRKGIAVSLILHLLAVLFVFVLGAGKSGPPGLERSIEVSLRSYEPRTAERESLAERKKRPRPAEKAKAPAKRPAKAEKPKPAKKPPAVKKKPETVKKPAAERKPPEKKAVAKPPRRPGPPDLKEKPRAPERPKPPGKTEPAPAVEPSPPLEEKRAPAPEPPADRKKEVIRDIRKESVIRSLREVPGENAPSPETQGAPDESAGEPTAAPREAPAPPAREKKEPAGEAASGPALESVRKNPAGEGARRASEESSPRVLSLVLDVYYKAISRQIEKNLILPLNVEPRGFMTALVSFRMRPGGEVYDVEISEGSGNDVFDFYCIKAVNASSPLPVPPSELRGRISAEPFVVPCKNRK